MALPLSSLPRFLEGQSTLLTSIVTATPIPADQLASASSTFQGYIPIPTSISGFHDGDFDDDDDDDNFLGLSNGTRAAFGVGLTIAILIIVLLSVWYCCGGCGLRAKRKRRREALHAPVAGHDHPPLPLHTLQASDNARGGVPGDAPPPLYEEAVPPQHRHIAGGATHVRQEEEEGIISDGKTPLSEIAFEDVVLDHSPSEGSSRSFSDRHHGLGGDTTGHTNS